MSDIFTDDGRLINVKGMLELENYHFVITKEIADSGKAQPRMLVQSEKRL